MKITTVSARALTLALAFLCCCLGLVSGQGTTASVTGIVTDEGGAIVPGVTVTVTNVGTGIARTQISDDGGRYRMPALNLGRYEVKAELAGFQTSLREGIELTVGRTAMVDLVLKVGQISERVTVTGEAPLVETTSSTLSGLVTTQQIADLPLNGRNMIALTLMEGGVSNMIRGSQSNSSIVRGYGIDLTVAGARTNHNSFLLDGADINDVRGKMPGSLAGVQMGVDSIREFKVLTSNFSAEYGRAPGGVITAVTKSGTNDFHGSVFEFLRNSALDANSFIANSTGVGKSPFKRNQYGFSIGGPIVKDKAFFFANYEGLKDRLGVNRIANTFTQQARLGILPGVAPITVAPAVKPYLDLWPLPDVCGAVLCRDNNDGTAQKVISDSEPTNENYIVAKVDHNFAANHSVFVRFTKDKADRLGNFNTVTRSLLDTGAQYWTIEQKSILSPQLLNVVRYSFNRTTQNYRNNILANIDKSLFFLPNATQMGAILMAGAGPGALVPVLQPTPYDDAPRLITQNVFQYGDSVTYDRGRHSWKFGADIRRYQANVLAITRNGGRYNFASIATFLAGTPNQFTGPLPGSDPYRGEREWIPGFYLQNDFQVRHNLTLNLGLRYEFYSVPTEVSGKVSNLRYLTDTQFSFGDPYWPNPSKKNFAPRVGFSWDPFGDGKTSIRSGFGIYHELIDIPGAFQQPWTAMPPAAQLSILTAPIPFPNPLVNGIPAQAKPPAFAFPWGAYNIPYLMRWNLSFQREVMGGLVASVGYIGSRGVHLTDEGLYQQCYPELSPEGFRFVRRGCISTRNPNFGAIMVEHTPGSSFYHGMAVKVNRRLTHGVTIQAAYTLSKSIDDTTGGRIASGPGGTVNNWGGAFDNIHALRALSDFDVRNNFNLNGTWSLPGPHSGMAAIIAGGWQLNGILTLSDGYPVAVKQNVTYVGDGATIGAYMPDLIPGGNNNPVLGGPDKYFDLSQFAPSRRVSDPAVLARCTTAAPCTFFGNLGRNTLIAPGVATLDFSLTKRWPLGFVGEEGNVEFRSEFFNILNHSNFDAPQLMLYNATGGPVGTAGRILATSTTARQIQFGLKITF